jgi:hypothetical protein
MRIRSLVTAVLVSSSAFVGLTGCGALNAVTNPGGAWAFSEPATMSVVVRRADVAHLTANQVDRLIGETPIDDASTGAMKLTKADAETLLKEAGSDPVYGGQPLRVVPAEAWLKQLSHACAEDQSAPSLIAMLGEDVAGKYTEVSSQGRKIAALKGKKAAAEDKADADGVSDADKAKYAKEVADIEAQIDKLDADYGPKVEALVASIKGAAAKASAEDKAVMGPIVVNLLEAVDDARNANSAALMRYPLAAPSITSDLQEAAKRFAADVVEEQTGHRPELSGLSPDIKLDGTDVKLTLNGIPHDKIGDIEPDVLVEQTTLRTQEYAGVALTLPAYVAETDNRLSFQYDLLEAWRDGLAASTGAEGTVDISDLEVAAAKGAPAEAGETKGKRSPGGILVAKCERPSNDDDAEEVEDAETADETAKLDGKGAVETKPTKKPAGAKSKK